MPQQGPPSAWRIARRRLCQAVLGLAASAPKARAQARDLTVVSWGGAYQDAQRDVFFRPFQQQSGGTRILEENWDGGVGVLRAKVQSGANNWDLVQVESEELLLGCEEGLFERIDWDAIGGRDHYIPQAVNDCGGHEIVAIDAAIHHQGGGDHGVIVAGLRQFLGQKGHFEGARHVKGHNLGAGDQAALFGQESFMRAVHDIGMPACLDEGDTGGLADHLSGTLRKLAYGPRTRAMTAPGKGTRPRFSFIQTVTVGPGVSPDLLTPSFPTGARGL